MHANEIIERTEKGVKESNRILIQELMHDLEEKGIQPVVAIDGEVRSLKLIAEDELDDFYKSVAKFNFSEDDFCVLEADESKSDAESPCGTIVVVYKKLGRTRKYKAGKEAGWVVEFSTDLKNNFFTK